MQELHSTRYSAHPGIQRNLGKVTRSFFWRANDGGHLQFCGELPSVSDGEI